METFSTEGNHIILDIWEANSQKLNDPNFIINTLKKACIAAGATILKENYVQFEPEGVTAFLILSESHCSIHSWPSKNYASIDCYTCGKTNVEKTIPIFLIDFEAKKHKINILQRGVF